MDEWDDLPEDEMEIMQGQNALFQVKETAIG